MLAQNPIEVSKRGPQYCEFINLAGLLVGIEMYWGGAIKLNTAIELLRKLTMLEISLVEIGKAYQEQVDVVFHIDNFEVREHLTTAETASGYYNLLLMLDLPAGKRSWHSFLVTS
jgi:hypothetical protein